MLTRKELGKPVIVAIVLVCLAFAPCIAAAQGSAIGGTVTDTTSGVLPGVVVEARSPSIIEGVRDGCHRRERSVPGSSGSSQGPTIRERR